MARDGRTKRWSAALAASLFLSPAAALADETARETICRFIDGAAASHSLPPSFFTRLIWKESSFRTGARSRAGAQGLAQFMPATARERGLTDPFDPEQAIPASAKFLSELKGRFGSLGLAAAAYNAGPSRVAGWIAGTSELPAETRRYVVFVTGAAAEDWRSGLADARDVLVAPAAERNCMTTLASIAATAPDDADSVLQAAIMPWGIQLSGARSKRDALGTFAGMQKRYARVIGDRLPTIIATKLGGRGNRHFFRVRIAFDDRASAQRLCGKLRAAGGSCLVVRN